MKRTTPTRAQKRELGALAAAGLATTLLVSAGGATASAGQVEAEDAVVNGKIAFASTRDGNYEIYVMDADGGNPTNLTTHDARDWQPALSPDGTKIVFTSDRNGNTEDSTEIYVMDVDGGNPTRLTTNDATDRYPAFSPDGAKIAFASLRDSNFEIYVMDVDGGNQTRLTTHSGFDEFPAFSPDGTKIAFTSSRPGGGNFDIYVMDVEGGNPTRLTTNPAIDASPAFSPDGTKIAFTSLRDSNPEIYVMDVDGDNQTRLTTNDANDDFPAFSPDGTKITFASRRDGDWEVYVMDVDGGNPTRLTTNDAIDWWPSWGGVPAQTGDTVPPVITAPQTVTATATSITGATVTFEATATDDVDGDLPVTCEPASETLFPLGATDVECSAADTAGNTGTATITVTVTVGAGAQGLTVLTESITALGLRNGVTKSLLGPLNQSIRLLTDTNPGNDSGVCDKLTSFTGTVADRLADGSLTPTTATQLTAYAEALAATNGCS